VGEPLRLACRHNGEASPPLLVSISLSRHLNISVGRGAAMSVVLICDWLANSPVGGIVQSIHFPLVFGSRLRRSRWQGGKVIRMEIVICKDEPE
jgi:hypothetical protein